MITTRFLQFLGGAIRAVSFVVVSEENSEDNWIFDTTRKCQKAGPFEERGEDSCLAAVMPVVADCSLG
jgi:hypothetical protein